MQRLGTTHLEALQQSMEPLRYQISNSGSPSSLSDLREKHGLTLVPPRFYVVEESQDDEFRVDGYSPLRTLVLESPASLTIGCNIEVVNPFLLSNISQCQVCDLLASRPGEEKDQW